MFLDSKRDARATFEAAIADTGEVIAPAMEATELSVSGVRCVPSNFARRQVVARAPRLKQYNDESVLVVLL